VLSSVGVGIALFLLLFNAGHLALRVWAFRTGLTAGSSVGPSLRRADLGGLTQRVGPLLAVASGLVLGALALPMVRSAAFVWVLPASVAFWFGARWGALVWKPALLILGLGVVGVCILGRLP